MINAGRTCSKTIAVCDHNCIPCRRVFRAGWVCVRCGRLVPAPAAADRGGCWYCSPDPGVMFVPVSVEPVT